MTASESLRETENFHEGLLGPHVEGEHFCFFEARPEALEEEKPSLKASERRPDEENLHEGFRWPPGRKYASMEISENL